MVVVGAETMVVVLVLVLVVEACFAVLAALEAVVQAEMVDPIATSTRLQTKTRGRAIARHVRCSSEAIAVRASCSTHGRC